MGEQEPAPTRELVPELAASPGYLMWRAHARVMAALSQELPAGVDIHAYAAMLALGKESPASQQTVADLISISRTTMANVASDLVELGLVERVRNPADRRAYLLTLTPAGETAAPEWRRHAQDLEEVIGRPFSEREHSELRRLLLRIVSPELSPRTPQPLLDSVGFLITRTHLRMHREFSAVLGPLRLEPRQFGALTALRSLGPQPQAELARSLGLSGASVVQMVDSMERRGLVERRRLPTDRRTQVLHLLPEADDVLERAAALADTTIATRFAALTDRQVGRLVALLLRFVTAP